MFLYFKTSSLKHYTIETHVFQTTTGQMQSQLNPQVYGTYGDEWW